MQRTYLIPGIAGFAVAIALTIPAGLADWSATAVYGIVVASIITAAVLFALTERAEGSSHR